MSDNNRVLQEKLARREKVKYCTKCKQHKYTTSLFWGYSADTPDGLKPHCKACLTIYNETRRQKNLEAAKIKGDTNIRRCQCGRLFSIVKGGPHRKIQIHKTECLACCKAQPLVNVYIPQLGRNYMGRIVV